MAVGISQPESTIVSASTVTPKSEDWTNGMIKAPRNVVWYLATLTRVPEIANQIFRDYSGISEDKIIDHIHRVRDKAWDIQVSPDSKGNLFLDCPACLSPAYPEVLHRIRAGQTFLDLGCCFGQDIRKLIHDGAPSENILGVDTESRFVDLGYELFEDREKLKASFYTQDVFDENFLVEWRGKIDIIFLGSFLHLFSFAQQKAILAQLTKLLRRREGSLVFGRHLATESGGTLRTNALGWSLYHHSPETIRQLWERAPEGEWDVSAELIWYESEGWNNGVNWQGGEEIKQMIFSATTL